MDIKAFAEGIVKKFKKEELATALDEEMDEVLVSIDSMLDHPEKYSADCERMAECHRRLAESKKLLAESKQQKRFHISGDALVTCLVSLLEVMLILGAEATGVTPFTKAMGFLLKLKA